MEIEKRKLVLKVHCGVFSVEGKNCGKRILINEVQKMNRNRQAQIIF